MSEPETLSSEYTFFLLQRQNMLQAEAQTVLDDLKLIEHLSSLGSPVLQGSSVLGLMVWPDIDLTVSCPGLTIDQVMKAILPIYAHPKVMRVRYHNEVGGFNPTGLELDDRYYFGVYYHASTGTEWKIDISFWSSTEEHPEPFHETVTKLLTDESRLAILWIKDVWYRLPTYRVQVYSVDIYDAVLSHAVRTPSEFDEYLIKHGKPAR